jgi:hypothetical protein|tara:strand:+ start:1364 stop:1759 length:396 start_codon:yes stop_codon:yes gene_type:complete
MQLNIRRLTSEDYSTLVKWWDAWKWQAPPQTFLPDTGFIVEKNDIGIVAGYIYMTNSKAALLEWVISNPDYRESDRKDAIELLIQAVERVLQDQGIVHVFTIGRNKHLINTHKKLGWIVDEKPSYEIIKNL